MTAPPIDLARASGVLVLLRADGKPVTVLDRTTGELTGVPLALAVAPEGLLPVFLAAGDMVWRQATGKGLGLVLEPAPRSLLGYRAEAVTGGTFAGTMLSLMEAIAQVERPAMLLVNDLSTAWNAAMARLEQDPRLAPRPGPSPSGS